MKTDCGNDRVWWRVAVFDGLFKGHHWPIADWQVSEGYRGIEAIDLLSTPEADVVPMPIV
jgi:hypothetical protein